jgi:hypothetical protein
MAIINNPNITNDLINLLNQGSFDVNALTAIVNAGLPAGQQLSAGAGVSTGIYKRFGQFDKVDAKIEVVTTGLWSGDSGSLMEFYTSSTQVAATSGQYYYNVYDKDPTTNSTAEVQLALAYGHVSGSGSVTLDINENGLLASKATYAQYKTMLLDNPTNNFVFETSTTGTTVTSPDIYVINIARNRFREEMDAGNWELALSGSNGFFTFIDDSGKKFGDTLGKAGRVFKVVEGTLNLGTQLDATVTSTYETLTGESYGLFYPDRGIMVLNPKAIGAKVGNVWTEDDTNVGDLTGSLSTAAEQYNHKRLYYAIKNGEDFDARRTEDVNTQHFFVRATNREFNYSNNPTYYTSNGSFNEPSFETDPQTFITTVGLYNDANELMAVAKTSQPIVKSFDKEVLIKVKLSF